MKALYNSMIGLFGNQLFEYAATRAAAQRLRVEFKSPAWIGEKIFMLPPVNRPQPGDTECAGYHQNQKSACYTRTQARAWFRFKPEIEAILQKTPINKLVWHFRDYGKAPWLSTLSPSSYSKAAAKFGYKADDHWEIVKESSCVLLPGCEQFPFLPDFYRLMKAEVLFRANSTFSMWAAWLGNPKVYAPIVTGLPGGQVVEAEFVEGNWPRCCDFPDVGDIHLAP